MDRSCLGCSVTTRCMGTFASLSLAALFALACADGAETGQSTRFIGGDAGAPGEPELRITALLPSSNPRGGPVMIRGENLGDATDVLFGTASAEFEVLSNAELAVQVPGSLPWGPAPVRVVSGDARSEAATFEVIADFPLGPPSPSRIVASDPVQGFAIPALSAARFVGLNSGRIYGYEWTTGCVGDLGVDGLRYVQGYEMTIGLEGQRTTSFYGTWDMRDAHVQLVMLRPDGAENYTGALHEDGAIVLQSIETGRQLVLPVGLACAPCEGAGLAGCSCPEGMEARSCHATDLCCSTADHVDQACIDALCDAEL